MHTLFVGCFIGLFTSLLGSLVDSLIGWFDNRLFG